MRLKFKSDMKRILILLSSIVLSNLIAFSQLGWTPLTSGVTYELSSVFFIEQTGYAVGGNGQTNGNVVLKTINAGENWSISCRTELQFYSIFFTKVSTGYAVDYDGIIQTTDGGATWTRVFDNQSLSKYSFLKSIFFADTLTGYCVGGFDQFNPILKTSDGGKTWTDKSSEFNKALNSVYFVDALTGYVVGSAGTILKTNDGGTTWSKQASGTSAYFSSVYFLDANTGYVVGSGGTILKTTNGGTNWTAQTSGTTNELKSVYFTNANTGYIVGGLATEYGCCQIRYEGTILKTTDGGINWTPQTGAETNYLYSVCFIDDSIGFAVGTNGLILKTTTGGTNSINDITFDKKISIYPNPNDGDFTVKYNNSTGKLLLIRIKDLSGKTIFENTCSQNSFRFNKKVLNKGLYIVSIIGDDIYFTSKMIVK